MRKPGSAGGTPFTLPSRVTDESLTLEYIAIFEVSVSIRNNVSQSRMQIGVPTISTAIIPRHLGTLQRPQTMPHRESGSSGAAQDVVINAGLRLARLVVDPKIGVDP